MAKSEKAKWLDKMRARMRALEKKGFETDYLKSKVSKIEGVSLTGRSFTVEGDLTDEIVTAVETAIPTATQFVEKLKEDAYNVHKAIPDTKELVRAEASRAFMTSYMDDYFKSYYDLVEEADKIPELTSKRKRADSLMSEIGRLLHDGEETRAKEKIIKLKEFIDGKEEE